jgi:excinuclease UvrABC nuclease subunit
MRAALDVFDGGATRFRSALQALRDEAVAAERYEDAIGYRDAVNALDRTRSALDVVTRATNNGVIVIVEGDTTAATAHVLVHGFRFTVLRFTQEQIAAGEDRPLIARAITRAARCAAQPARITPRRLKDILIVDAYRQQHAPGEIVVDDDYAAAAARVSTALRRTVRAPRKRHAAASGV